jgi:hypothetical protein
MDSFTDPDHGSTEETPVRSLSRRQRDIAVVGWCSFLIAAVGTMVLFAWVDPAELAGVTEPPLDVGRMSGYAIGFFFLWSLTAASAVLTVFLIRTRRGHPPA